MRTVSTRTGAEMPVLGQGTWRMGEHTARRAKEVAALRFGLDVGMTLIDTAEMYADGGAEEVVAEAIRGRRNEVFLVTKVLPHNASRDGTVLAAERSLRRLDTDRIDLYLLHWPGPHPLEATLDAFRQLAEQGKILHYGLSNFDVRELEACEKLHAGRRVAANQILYNLHHRGVERGLLPWCRHRGVVVMAYSPLDETGIRENSPIRRVAERHGVTPSQVALAWAIRHDGIVTIPKASDVEHVGQNAAAAGLVLDEEDLLLLHDAYPPPSRDVPLETA